MMRTKKGATGLALGAVVALAAAACSSWEVAAAPQPSSAAAAARRAGRSTSSTSGRTTASTRSRATSARTSSSPAACTRASLVTYSVGEDSQADPRPGHRHRTDVRRRQDVEVHARRHGEVAGRPEGHLRRRQVRHLADLRDRRHLQRPDLHPQLPRRPERRRRLIRPTRARTRSTGQALFDKAVTCAGNDPDAALQEAVGRLQLRGGLPRSRTRRSARTRTRATSPLFDVFSNGPYMLEGTFDPNKGGTWVRNPNWDESTDKVRKAYPDKIVDVEGIQSEQIYQRLLADGGEDKNAITLDTGPAVAAPADRVEPVAARRARSTPPRRTSTTCSRTSRARS